MNETIHRRVADLKQTFERLEGLLQQQTPPLLLARLLLALDEMAATMNRHVDALQGARSTEEG